MKKNFDFTLPIINIFSAGINFAGLIRVVAHNYDYGLLLSFMFAIQIIAFALHIWTYNQTQKQKEDNPEIKRNFGDKPVPPPSKILNY